MDVGRLIDSVGVPLWQHRREFAAFLELIRQQQVRSVLEIGTGFGGSAYCFGEVIDRGQVVTIDMGTLVKPGQRRAQPNPSFVQIDGDSRTDEVEDKVWAFAPFDLVWFDGEHPYEDCADHYRRYAPMANKLIAQHDVNMDEVAWPDAGIPRFWREWSATRRTQLIVDPDPDPRFPRWGGIGVALL